MSILKAVGWMLLLLLAMLVYKVWQPSEAQFQDYQALLCLAIQDQTIQDQGQILAAMQRIHSHSYPDYAFQRPEFKPRFAKMLYQHYAMLADRDKMMARRKIQQCQSLTAQH